MVQLTKSWSLVTGSQTPNQQVVVLPIEEEGEAMAAIEEEVIIVEWQEEAHSGSREGVKKG